MVVRRVPYVLQKLLYQYLVPVSIMSHGIAFYCLSCVSLFC